MKKLANVLTVVLVLALLAWAGSHISTVMAKMLNVLDTAAQESGTRFIDTALDEVPTLPPETLELTDQDYDAVQAESDAWEDIQPQATDYLTDGDEMLPVDETAAELAGGETAGTGE